jgi:hypothetical protein
VVDEANKSRIKAENLLPHDNSRENFRIVKEQDSNEYIIYTTFNKALKFYASSLADGNRIQKNPLNGSEGTEHHTGGLSAYDSYTFISFLNKNN